MTRSEFLETKEITQFCKGCLDNEFQPEYLTIQELWEKASDINEFKKFVKENKEVRLSQGAAELLKDDWNYLRSMLSDKMFKTDSEAGSVKIGNENFSILIPNGMGDGTTRVDILNSDEFNRSAFYYFTIISGKFNIYSYDCGEEIEKEMNGKFQVYYKDGIVIFEVIK